MTDEEFAVLIELGSEQTNVEFKGPGNVSDKHFVARVTRAILGMTNRRDGGYVILGVNDKHHSVEPVGMEESVLAGWTQDSLADKVAPLVDPSVSFSLERRLYHAKRFVLIVVREFDETPVFCRQSRNDAQNDSVVLREGALYVRSRRKPETIEIRTSQEMRDLLDLALMKRFQRFGDFLALSERQTGVAKQSDSERFENQLFKQGLLR